MLSSTVRSPAASIQPVWLVRQTPVKFLVPRLATSKGPAAPNHARHDAGNARNSLRSPDPSLNPTGSRVPITFFNPARSRVSITFLIPAARTSTVGIPASNYVRSGTFAANVPPSAVRVAITTVANSGARCPAHLAPSRVRGHVLIKFVQSLVDR